MKFEKLVVAIPTRNRSDLAINSIRSVLNQLGDDFEVVVSDNSTEITEIESLRKFCEEINDHRLTYIKPEESLSMTKHWDWIVKTILKEKHFSHITFLTDRMLFVPSTLTELRNILAKYPNEVISYYFNGVADYEGTPTLVEMPFTGKLFEIQAKFLIDLSAEITFTYSLPRMMNSVAPKSLITRILAQDASVFESISPDYYFAYNCLDLIEKLLFYDKPLLVSYAENRSNGNSAMRGVMSKTTTDFYQTIDSPVTIKTPLPFMLTPTDAVLNEYFYVKEKSKSGKFSEINKRKYEVRTATDLISFKNSKLKYQGLVSLYKSFGFRMMKYHLKGLFPVRQWLSKEASIGKGAKFNTTNEAIAHLMNAKTSPDENSEDYLKFKIGEYPFSENQAKEKNF